MHAQGPALRPAGVVVLALLVGAVGGCREAEEAPTGPRPIDPSELRTPRGPPENLERLRRQPELPGQRQQAAEPGDDVGTEAVAPRPTVTRPAVHHDGLRLAAELVPSNASGALIVGSPGDLYEGVRRVLEQLSDAGIATVQPDRLGPHLRRMIGTDAMAEGAFETGGIDLSQPAALWWRERRWVLAIGVTEPEKMEAVVGRLMTARAALPGGCRQQQVRGAPGGFACVKDGDVQVGFARRGPYVFFYGGRGSPASFASAVGVPDRALRDHSDFSAVPLPDAPATLFMRPARQLWGGVVHLGVWPDRGAIQLRGASTRRGVPLGTGPAPFGGLDRAEALLTVRANLEGLPPLLDALAPSRALADACPRCPSGEVEGLVQALAEGLTGGSALVVRGIDIDCCPGDARPGDGWFIARHGWLAVVRDEQTASGLVSRAQRIFASAGLSPEPAERRGEGGGHFVARLPGEGERTIYFGHRGQVVYIGSDGTAIDAALVIGERPGGPALSLRVDPVVLSRSLVRHDTGEEVEPDGDEEIDLSASAGPGGALGLFQEIAAELGRVDDGLLPTVLTAEPTERTIRIQARMPLPQPRTAEAEPRDW